MRVIGTGGTTDTRQNQTDHQRARLQRLLFRVVSQSLFHLCAGGLGVKTMVRGDCVLFGVFVVWWCLPSDCVLLGVFFVRLNMSVTPVRLLTGTLCPGPRRTD